MRKTLLVLLPAFVVWAVCAWFDVAGQRALIYERGAEELYDFWMPRKCWEQGYASMKSSTFGLDPMAGSLRSPDKKVGDYVKFSDWYQTPTGLQFITGDMDKVYPALSLLPFAAFPATRCGGYAWSVAAAVVFLFACGLCFKTAWYSLLIPLTMPFIFNLERGNPVWLSAAAVAIFLAWWKSPSRGCRTVAAVALAVAAVLKIAPAILGLLYVFDAFATPTQDEPDTGFSRVRQSLRAGSLRYALIAAVCAIVLFFVPFAFVREGFAAIPIMFGNAAHHANFVLRTADFGFVQLWRSVLVAFGISVAEPWPGMYAAARLSQLFGLTAILVGAKRRDAVLLVGGMLLAAGNMYYYAALYLIPAFILQRPLQNPYGAVSRSLVFIILCPIQLIVLGHPANAVLCNLSTILLVALHLLRGERTADYSSRKCDWERDYSSRKCDCKALYSSRKCDWIPPDRKSI